MDTKLAKISPNGNTGRQLGPAPAALALRCLRRWRMALPAAHFQRRGLTNGPVYDDDYMEIFNTSFLTEF